MYKHKLQVWGEDLAVADISQTSVDGEAVNGGGTNGGPIHTSNGGVPVIVIGVPVRYIHSHYGFACVADYKNSIKLAVEIIKRLNDEQIKKF